jgi:hypothetical protein
VLITDGLLSVIIFPALGLTLRRGARARRRLPSIAEQRDAGDAGDDRRTDAVNRRPPGAFGVRGWGPQRTLD